jgi:hypothetical protein
MESACSACPSTVVAMRSASGQLRAGRVGQLSEAGGDRFFCGFVLTTPLMAASPLRTCRACDALRATATAAERARGVNPRGGAGGVSVSVQSVGALAAAGQAPRDA